MLNNFMSCSTVHSQLVSLRHPQGNFQPVGGLFRQARVNKLIFLWRLYFNLRAAWGRC